MRSNERGFTVVELLIGAAIASFVILLAVMLASRLANWTSALDTRVQSSAAAERLMERLSSEAASAWAVFVPAQDLSGKDNSDGHEVDFFSQDGSHRPYAWAYAYDPTSKMVTRYNYAPGVAAQPGEEIGPFDTFAASPIDATQIGTADPLFAGASTTSVHYAFAGTTATGGNSVVKLQLGASGVNRSELLASGTAPTTFTVVVNYTPSPAPVATSTPTPMGPGLPAPTLTPTPTLAPTAAPTPAPTATATQTSSPTPCPTNCSTPPPGCPTCTTTQTFNQLFFSVHSRHAQTEWGWGVYDKAQNLCLSAGTNQAGTFPTQPCQSALGGSFSYSAAENVAVLTSSSMPAVSPALGYTFYSGCVYVGVAFLNLGGNQWQEQLGATGCKQLGMTSGSDYALPGVTFIVTTN